MVKPLLFVVLSACAACAPTRPYPARTHAHIWEGANVVAVLLPDSGAVAIARITRLLEQRGFHVTGHYAATLETAPMPAENQHCAASVQVQVMGHTALLSGQNFCWLLSGRARPLYYSARSQVPALNYDCVAWGLNQLEAVAEALHGEKTVHFRRP